MCVLSIKVPIRKKSGNLFNDPRKLTIEQGVICNGDLIIPPEIQRKLVIKSVHDDIHCGVEVTQKRMKLEA